MGSNQIESGNEMGKEIVKLYKEARRPKLKGIYMRGIAGYITDEIRNKGVKETLKEEGPQTRSSGRSNTRISRAPSAIGRGINPGQIAGL